MNTEYDDTELESTETGEPEVEDRGDDFEPVPDEPELEAGGADDEPPEDNEAEASLEDEGEEPEAQEPAEEDKDESKAIPQSRFNEINQRYKEEREERLRLAEENARLKALSEKPEREDEAPPVNLDALEDQLDAAILEGDTTAARALRRQIRQVEREQINQQAAEAAQRQLEAREQALENQRLAQTAVQIAQKYPQLDGQSEQADSVLIDMVISYRDRLIASGTKPSDALAQAAEVVAQRALPAAKPAKLAAVPKIDAQKNLAREAQIPARATGSRGARSQAAVDYSSLSDAEFARLSEEDIRRARGDFL